MKNSTLIAKRFREVMLDGKWVAFTNFKEQVADLNLEQATTIVANLNTIAALTFHLNYYIKGVLDVFEGGELTIRDKFSYEMKEFKSEIDWEHLKQNLWKNSEAFAKHVENFSNEELQGNFVKEEYGSLQRNLDGMIEHCYYHFGQVVIIKKCIMEKNTIL